MAALITPESLAGDSEHSQQAALFCWAAMNERNDYRLKLLHAIPNGANFGDDKKSRQVRGNRMRREGLKTGVPDIFLPVPAPVWGFAPNEHHGLYIEMKRPDVRYKRKTPAHKWDTGGVDEEQVVWLNMLEQQGYKCVVCYSWWEAANEIKFYLTGSGLE
jgi:hypothetical protein